MHLTHPLAGMGEGEESGGPVLISIRLDSKDGTWTDGVAPSQQRLSRRRCGMEKRGEGLQGISPNSQSKGSRMEKPETFGKEG